MTQIRGRVWRAGKPQDDFEFSAISDCLIEHDTLVWADIYDPDHAALKDLAQELGLNSWAVEDAVAESERTKASIYKTHTFFTVYAVQTQQPPADDYTQSTLSFHRISGFVLPQGLITVRLPPEFDIEPVSERFDRTRRPAVWGRRARARSARCRGRRPLRGGAVARRRHRVHRGRPVCRQRSAGWAAAPKNFRLRKDLVELRRVVLPMREVVNSIQHRRLDAKTAPELDPLYADLYDHVLRVSEWTESLRDMVTTVFETNLSLQDARLNTVMKKLTGWAAIIAVPTAITGFYGQNVNYPGINTVAGFITSTVIIVLLVAILYLMFRRRDWL